MKWMKVQCLFVSFDVVSLYTSIPHDLGLTAVKYWVENHKTSLHRPYSTEFILEAVELVLKENTFQFNNKHYQQIQGTAMGTKMAPTYATLLMGRLDTKDEFIQTFKRFLDDCFTFWKKSEDELHKLHELFNSLHEKIQFTMETSKEKLPFLS